jgi:hypothetical protein
MTAGKNEDDSWKEKYSKQTNNAPAAGAASIAF